MEEEEEEASFRAQRLRHGGFYAGEGGERERRSWLLGLHRVELPSAPSAYEKLNTNRSPVVLFWPKVLGGNKRGACHRKMATLDGSVRGKGDLFFSLALSLSNPTT
uniref:Uncharacterized protein n=1 Tax=Oryza nivara TaxID=4536 RepID=A0A0E0G494_ORYNI